MLSFTIYVLLTLLVAKKLLPFLPNGSLVLAFPAAVFLSNAAVALILGVLALFDVGFSNAVVYLVLSMSVVALECFARIERISDVHRDLCNRGDLIPLFAVFFVIAGCFVWRYGLDMSLNYATSDPAVHLRSALRISEGASVSGQYFAYIPIAVLVSCFPDFSQTVFVYKFFLIVDNLYFVFSGILFLWIARTYSPKLGGISKALIAVLYLLAYPLNNMLFGFYYLGVGVSAAGLVLLYGHELIEVLSRKEAPKRRYALTIGVVLSLYALITSYSLFVPIVYSGLFISLTASAFRCGFSIKQIAIFSLSVFIVPVILGFFMVYLSFFGGDVSVGGAIATEGYIYRDLFSSLALFIPPAIFGFFTYWRNCAWGMYQVTTAVLLCAMASLFVLGVVGFVSSYYYFKCYYLLWLFMFIALTIAFGRFDGDSLLFARIYGIFVVVLFSVFVSGADAALSSYRQLFNPAPASNNFFPIFAFNKSQMQSSVSTVEKLSLFECAGEIMRSGSRVAIVASDAEIYWFDTLTRNYDETPLYWKSTSFEYLKEIQSFDFIVSLDGEVPLETVDGCNPHTVLSNLMEESKTIFKNSAGAIHQLR